MTRFITPFLRIIIAATALTPHAHARVIDPIDTATANEIAVDAYLYTYPLMIMDKTRRTMTIPISAMGLGPANKLNHMRFFPKPGFKAVIRPNFDTLYSSAWLDLSREPMVVSIPDMGDRYFLLQFLDMWTEVFAAPGKRTTGSAPRNIVVVPPNWQGSLPKDLSCIDSPTPHAWIIGRIQTNGREDIKSVRQLQDGFTITTLSEWTSSPKPNSGDKPARPFPTLFRDPDKLSARAYFHHAAQLLRVHPPHPDDAAILSRMREIGFIAGEDFHLDKLPPHLQHAFEQAPATAQKRMRENEKNIAPTINGWRTNTGGIGNYGTDYLKRAIIAKTALGANAPEDAVYPMADVDNTGHTLNGAHRYIIHFPKDQLPPVEAFWSITVYKLDGFPTRNSIGRYAIGDRNPLRFNPDGSLDIYLQHNSPGPDKETNWLPTPKKQFNLTMRLYWPKDSVLIGAWTPPPATRTVDVPNNTTNQGTP